MNLSKQEVRARMVELHNLRKLHAAQKIRIIALSAENKKLKERVAVLEALVDTQKRTIADFRLQLEEFRTIVFGKKRKKDDDRDIPPIQTKEKEPRTVASYKRAMPEEHEVTETKQYALDACARCHGALRERETVAYFEEDIRLPRQKIVVRHVVEKGYCPACRRWSAATPLLSASVILGPIVKRYVTYLSVVCRQSYGQIQDILRDAHGFDLSQGEIANILEKEGVRLCPAYERLKERIRGEPSVHLDETSWRLFIGDGCRRFAWTMAGGESDEAVFILGKTRGKGNAADLLAESKAVVVSDDYPAYRNLNNPHQLCCAHILRKVRDLAVSGEIAGTAHDHCVAAYRTFAGIYADIETARHSSSPRPSYGALFGRLTAFAVEHPCDPAKLIRIKRQVSERTANYLTCLLHPSVASDNNAAERSLRHLVLKRKISFGSLNEKTAETLAILCSILLSYKRQGTLRGYLMGV